MTDFMSTIATDNYRLARSKTLVNPADATYNLIVIPKFAFIDQIWLYITTAYAGGGSDATGTIGFLGNGETADPDGFMDIAACAVTATGIKRMTDDGQPGSKGKWFNSASGQLTITLAVENCTTVMTGFVFMRYSVLH